MNKKCLLIACPNISAPFPRGMMEIASFLESRGCPTSVLPISYYLNPSKDQENNLGFDKQIASIIEKEIKRINPGVIGVSNQFTYTYPDCLKILKICKKINPKIMTVIGGPHVTFLDLDCIRSPFIDVVVRGEGEWTMLGLLSAVEQKRDLGSVKGITFKKNRQVFRTSERPLGNLNELPTINFELLPQELVRKSTILGILNRGCAYDCKFCAEREFWLKRRSFSIQRLINEMKVLDLKYKNKMAGLDDGMVYIGSRQFFEFCSELKRNKIGLSPDFYVISRIDAISEPGLKALNKSHINNVCLGIESASEKVLKMMNKNITLKQIIAACQKLRRYKINIASFWIIGHPGDDFQEARYSLGIFRNLFTEDLIQFAHIFLFTPFPGTIFFRQPQKHGIEILTYDWSKWTKGPFGIMGLYAKGVDKPVCQLKNFPADEIVSVYKKFAAVARGNLILQNYLQKR